MNQALYRKYRPQTFEQIYGQDNIVNILKNQIENNNISHAYIFSGTRGTGKTSTAKIFAKAVNCLDKTHGSPCNKCSNCLAIQEESSMDIVEMDAASNRGIEDIRQIREQVIYPPTLLKYKVYIIDEAHMITNEGFNALLKIMEEPPKHLIFILATTEIEKIPNTILSRTQRFEFKSISIEDIKSQIRSVLEKENVRMEERAIEVIANVASGAMRDALSILDQVISIGKKEINVTDVYDLLGVFSDNVKVSYCQSIFNKDVVSLYKIIDEEINRGKDPNHFIKEIVSFFNELIYIKIGTKENIFGDLIDDISLDQLVNSIDILIEYEEKMKKSDSSYILFKLASTRLIDYMPRKLIEAKIKNLEERLIYIEEHGVVSSNIVENKTDLPKQSVSLDDINDIFEDFDRENKSDLDIEKIEETKLENTEALQENSISHKDILLQILKENYPHTNYLFEGLKHSEQRTEKIIFYLDKSKLSMSLSMNFFFNKAKEDLYNKVGKKYDIIFEEYKEFSDNEEDQKSIEKLKKIFPEDKLIIKDKKQI